LDLNIKYKNFRERCKISSSSILPRPDIFTYTPYVAELKTIRNDNIPEDITKKIVIYLARQFKPKRDIELTQNLNKDEKKFVMIQKFVDDAWNGEIILDNQKNIVS